MAIDKFLSLTNSVFCQIDNFGRFIWVNRAMEKCLGQSFQNLTSKNFLDYVHPDDKKNIQAVLESILPDQITPASEIRFKVSKDAYMCYECNVYYNPKDKLYYIMANDISDKRRAEDQLLRLNAIVEASLDGIYAIDNNGCILSWNKAAEQIFGFTKDEIIGKSIHVLSFPEQHEEMENLINIIRRGETYSYESIRQKKSGETVAVFITLAPIKDIAGGVIGTSAVARDITNHRRLEKEMAQLDKLNTIVELASVISHEVRNPMTTVKGFLQLLYNKVKEEEFKEYFEIMIEEMDRVNSILQEFNTIGRHKESIRRKHNLKAIIKCLAPLLEADAVSQGKTIRFDLSETPDLKVDGNEIRQLILNLTRNALESMDQNGSILVKTYSEDDNVILAVQDQGKGIKQENLEKLGMPFFSTKESGTGLGLYVCYEIARRHDAEVKVDTSPNGTIFSVIFRRGQEE